MHNSKKIILHISLGMLTSASFGQDFNTVGSQSLAVPSGTYANIESFDDSSLTMATDVEATDYVRARDNSQVFMNGGSVGIDAEARDFGRLQMSGGSVTRYAESAESGTFELVGGLVGLDARSFGTSSFHMIGGQISRDAIGFGSSHFRISQGVVADDALVTNSARMTIDGGDVNGNAASFENSELTINGGTIGADVEALGSSVVNITGGSFYGDIQSFENSTVNMSGGEILGGFNFADARDTSTFNFSGGFVFDAQARDDAKFIMSGGNVFSDFYAFNDADITIIASSFGGEFSAGDVITLADLGPDPNSSQNPLFSGATMLITFPDGTYEQFDFRAENSGADQWTGTLTFEFAAPIPEPSELPLAFGIVALLSVSLRRSGLRQQ